MIRAPRRGLTGWAVSLCAVSAALAASPTDSPESSARARSAPIFTVYIENDSFTGSDESYTSGLKFSSLSADLVDWGQTGWRKTFVESLPFVNRTDGQKNIGVAIGQNIYTPRDIQALVPDPADRPYAGWLYLEFAFVSKTPAISDTFSIQTGIIGPHTLAEDTQRIVHHWIGSATPRGWAYQLRDEFGMNLVYERRWRLFARSLLQTFGADLVPHAGASLGNVQTYLNAGGTARIGINLPSDFGVQLAAPGAVGGTPADGADPRMAFDRDFSFFLFGAADGRAVAHDIFLDGNTFRASRSVNKNPFVADLSAGVGLIAGHWQLTYTQVWRTREFKTQHGTYNNFGSVTLSRAY